MINEHRSLLLYILFALTALSGCTSNKKHSAAISISTLKEGDTLAVQQIPINLGWWMKYHSSENNTISLKDFISSGVVLHHGELIELDSICNVERINKSKYLIFSPDQTKFIDLFSITTKDENECTDSLSLPFSSDIDQQIVLGSTDGKRVELLFCGAEQLVESADWLTNDQLILTLSSFQDSQYQVELYLFDLKLGIFTNFVCQQKPAKMKPEENTFIDFWLRTNKKSN